MLSQIQVILDREHEVARQCLAKGEKNKALTALRRRKYQESLIQKTDSQLETLEGLVSGLPSFPPRRPLARRQ